MAAYLTDFGLAKDVTGQAGGMTRVTRTGTTLGTPSYMSPEQARGELAELTAATDTWALGCVLFELLAGRRAFDGESPAAVIAAVLAAPIPRVREARPDATPGVDRVLRSLLVRDARHRYRDAATLRDDLARLLGGQRPSPPTLPVAWGRVGAIAAVLAVAALIAAAAWPRGQGAGTTPDSAPAVSEDPRARVPELIARARGLRRDDPDRARALLDEALALAPDSASALIERGLLHWLAGAHEAARADWRAVPRAAAESNDAMTWVLLHSLFERLQGPTRAEVAALLEGSGRRAALVRGALAVTEGRTEDALGALAGQAGWEVELVRAHALQRETPPRRAEAIAAYRAALTDGPTFPSVYENLSALHLGLAEFDRALECANRALELDPTLPGALANRGSARARQGDLGGGLEDLQAALAQWESPERANGAVTNRAAVLVNIAIVRSLQGDRSAALALLDQALALVPGLPSAHRERGFVQYHSGAFAEAVRDFTIAIDALPPDVDLLNARGGAWRELGKRDEALADWRAASALQPEFAPGYANVAILCYERGDWAGALAGFREFLRLAPDDSRAPQVRELVAECEANARRAAGNR